MVYAGGEKEKPKAADEPIAGKKITFLTHPTLYKAMGEAAAFQEFQKRSGVETEVITMPTPQIREKIMMEFVAGTGRYDVINLSNTIFNTDVVRYIDKLDDYIKNYPYDDYKDLFPALVDMFRYPVKTGSIYGIPFRTGTTLMFYRKDLFQKYNIAIPKNWDDFKAAVAKLTLDTNGDGKIDIYGYGIKCGDTHTISEDFVRYLFAFGGDILSNDLKKARINEKEGVAVADLLKYFVDKGQVHPDFSTWIRDDLIVAQQQGKVAISMQFSPYYGMITNPKLSPFAGQIDAFPVPTSPGVKEGTTYNPTWGLSIDAKSKNKRASWELIKFLTLKENQLTFAIKHANGPVSISVFENADYQKFLGPTIAKAWKTGLDAGLSTPPHPDYSQMEETWGQAIISVLLGKKTSQAALDEAAAKINTFLK
jgi:ABC-type glycerol-3-phosphate transport system substrate-binding protein